MFHSVDLEKLAPVGNGKKYALSSNCPNSGDRNTFLDHAENAVGANIHPYKTGADMVDWIRTLKNVDALYVYGHGSENGFDADGWTLRQQPGHPERPYGMMRGLYRLALDHTDGAIDQQSVTFLLDRAAGERNFSDLAEAVVAARFNRGATIYIAACHGEGPARMLSEELQARGRSDLRVVGANDWSNGSNPKYMSARPGCYLYFQSGKPEMVAGHQRSVRTLP